MKKFIVFISSLYFLFFSILTILFTIYIINNNKIIDIIKNVSKDVSKEQGTEGKPSVGYLKIDNIDSLDIPQNYIFSFKNNKKTN